MEQALKLAEGTQKAVASESDEWRETGGRLELQVTQSFRLDAEMAWSICGPPYKEGIQGRKPLEWVMASQRRNAPSGGASFLGCLYGSSGYTEKGPSQVGGFPVQPKASAGDQSAKKRGEDCGD
jgi:hypothetical protein